MPKTAIPRDEVHRLAEACSDDPAGFQPSAIRLTKDQRPLSRFFEKNAKELGGLSAQVGLYMLTVSLRVFEQVGGRMGKVTGDEIEAATVRVQQHIDALLPFDKTFPERAKAIADRAQPHLLDEILWALYERAAEEKKEGEADLDQTQSALTYIMLWAAIEALDARWQPPAGRA